MMGRAGSVNLLLLGELRRRRGQWLDANALARAHRLSLNLLDRELRRLTGRGYEIERDPSAGVRLVGVPGRLAAEEISCDLDTGLIGRHVIVDDELTSTNDEAWRTIRAADSEGADVRESDGLVIIALRQSAGRGRRGRAWASPIGGLWMSVVLRALRPARQSMLTMAAAVAVAEAVRETTRLEARIRWPNDVIIEGRKVSGVLVETQSASPGLYVLGIGVNVNVPAESLPAEVRAAATSLRVELGRDVSAVGFARCLLRRLDGWYNYVRTGDVDALNAAWRPLASTLGQRIKLSADGRKFEGVVVELDLVEGISLRLDGGAVRSFRSEEVSLVELVGQ